MRHENVVAKVECEQMPRAVLMPPLHEVLLHPEYVSGVFRLDDITRRRLLSQGEKRADLAGYMRAYTEAPPDTLSETQRAALHTRLGEVLLDPEMARLALYLPFEWLPDRSQPPEDEACRVAAEAFADRYLDAWWSLLRFTDTRVHYVDGDMRADVDAQVENLPRVVKAAHLIPFLLEKELLTETEVQYIYDGTDSEVLRSSIDDAMAVWRHWHEDGIGPVARWDVTPDSIEAYYDKQRQYVRDERDAAASERRLLWLEKVAYETTVQEAAEQLVTQPYGLTMASELISSTNMLLQSVGVVALGRIAESGSSEHDAAIGLLLRHNNQHTPYFSVAMRRLYHAGLVSRDVLDDRAIFVGELAGDLSRNLDLADPVFERVQAFVAAVEHDAVLRQSVYPVVLVGGSRLKGYGDEFSDIDLTICVRPDVDPASRDELMTRVRALLGEDVPHEFWLGQDEKGLYVREIETDDIYVAHECSVHMLFGMAWLGDEAVAREIQSTLYPRYFDDLVDPQTGISWRQIYLDRIEQDVLLYRLLHRGYAHQFPVRDGLSMPSAERIDGESVFYDAGYRRLATQLFIEKVFLPNLQRDK